jgi:hypothetical protein
VGSVTDRSRVAAKNGVHLMSVGATAQGGFDALALHWDVRLIAG